MFSMRRFETIINVFMGILLCAGLSVAALKLNNALGLEPFILSFISSFAVSYTVGDMLPLKAMGDKVASGLGLREGNFFFFMVSTFVITLVMIVFISFLMILLNIGFQPFIFAAWFSSFPILLLLGYIIELLFLPVAIKLAITLTTNKETAA